MADTLRLLVSTTRDLEPQGAVVGRAIANLPVHVGMEIRRIWPEKATPEPIFDLTADCDRISSPLSRDATAPPGSEGDIARPLEHMSRALRASVPLTPTARARGSLVHSDEALARTVSLDVTDLPRLSPEPPRAQAGRNGSTPAATPFAGARTRGHWKPEGLEGVGIAHGYRYTLDLPPDRRVEGTAVTVAIGVDRGADLARVHDVLYTPRVARMTDAIVRWNPSNG